MQNPNPIPAVRSAHQQGALQPPQQADEKSEHCADAHLKPQPIPLQRPDGRSDRDFKSNRTPTHCKLGEGFSVELFQAEEVRRIGQPRKAVPTIALLRAEKCKDDETEEASWVKLRRLMEIVCPTGLQATLLPSPFKLETTWYGKCPDCITQ